MNNPSWGEERIANDLLLKPGIRVSPRTVRKYMPKSPLGCPRGDQRWSTFVRNHASAILAGDFCVIVTARFRLLYVFIVIEHQTRRIVPCNVTTNPTATWTRQPLREAIPSDHRYRFLIHDRDGIFSPQLDQSISHMGIRVLRSPPRSPKANSRCERVIGTLRRECLDFLIPITESHLRCISQAGGLITTEADPTPVLVLAYLRHHPIFQSCHKYIDIAFQSILRWWPALSWVAYIMNMASSRMLLEYLRTTPVAGAQLSTTSTEVCSTAAAAMRREGAQLRFCRWILPRCEGQATSMPGAGYRHRIRVTGKPHSGNGISQRNLTNTFRNHAYARPETAGCPGSSIGSNETGQEVGKCHTHR